MPAGRASRWNLRPGSTGRTRSSCRHLLSPQPRTLAQYNFLEGVVWRNDPDHCHVLGEWLMDTGAMMPVFGLGEDVPPRTVIRPAICAMAGGVLMVSDKLEVYQDDRHIEGMKRSAPVLFTVPGQLYGQSTRKR